MNQKNLSERDLLNPSQSKTEEVLYDFIIFFQKIKPIEEILYHENDLPWDKNSIICCIVHKFNQTNDIELKSQLVNYITFLNLFIPSKKEIESKIHNAQMHLEMYKSYNVKADNSDHYAPATDTINHSIQLLTEFILKFK